MEDNKFTEVKETKKISEETKKTQDKIILITRITGVVIFLVGISIIFITAIFKSKQPIDDNVIEYESSADNIALYPEDQELLSEEYVVLYSMEDYNKLLNTFETWYQEALPNYTLSVNENENIDADTKQRLIDEYKIFNDGRYKKLKDFLSTTNITEETFKTNGIIVTEDITSHMVLQSHNITDICSNEGILTLQFTKEEIGVVGDITSTLYFIELDKTYAEQTINIVVDDINNSDPNVAYKPIIYIYPKQEQNVKVTLGSSDKLLVSYPVYNNGWNVLAKPDGTLIDNKTNRELYSLYYESENNVNFKIENEGFVISKDEIIPFLEEKLEILGLNPKEQEEFIIYWLPILQKNNYTYIRFATNEEINNNMSLQVEPSPDTMIRVLMIFKGLEEKINVKEQPLQKVTRNGYTVVEWGATIIE